MVMATEEGIIEKAFENKAVVRIQRNSACAHCQTKGACEMLSDKEMRIEVSNRLHAKDGDRVEISIPTRSLLKMSLFVYFLPIVALVIGAVLGGEFAEVFRLTPTTAVASSSSSSSRCLRFFFAFFLRCFRLLRRSSSSASLSG